MRRTRTDRSEENEVSGGSGLGLLPEISVAAAVGLILVAAGNAFGRAGIEVADLFFWGGIVLMVLPLALRLLDRAPGRTERIGLVALLGIALYLVKVLHSPDGFTLHDEILHLRTASDIANGQSLFTVNPLLLVSPLYPGLEIATTILSSVTGTDTYSAGTVVVGAARILLVLGLFLFFELASGDARIAGIASFVYMANPNFVFFDAQFGYESLAIGLAAGALHLILASGGRWRSGTAAALVLVAAVIVTHHVSTYAMVAFLMLWTVTHLLSRRAAGRSRGPWQVTALAIIGAGAWLLVVASETLRYLAPRILDGLALISLILGDVAGRELFRANTGEVAPLWERAVGFGAVILLLIALPIGLWRIWRDYRSQPAAVALGLAALTYPATLALRLTARGAEESSRTSGFVFLGLGFVVALAVASAPGLLGRRLPRLRPVVATGGLVLLVGGIIVGIPRWARLPGPYLVSADTRSIELKSITAARWAATELGPNHRIVADRTNRILMGSYGLQDPVTEYGDQIKSWKLFYSPAFGPEEQALLDLGAIEFLVIDKRLVGVRPLTQVYFESGEPPEVAREGRLALQGLTKYAAVPGVGTVFDAGDITIYDVRGATALQTP
ncbi:MAG: hypothetical protein H0U52_17065 [Chloroflexi bacterium]|nr:hypothetical protein [Chloroflexota bacterium]